jgi:hypothetical protein
MGGINLGGFILLKNPHKLSQSVSPQINFLQKCHKKLIRPGIDLIRNFMCEKVHF